MHAELLQRPLVPAFRWERTPTAIVARVEGAHPERDAWSNFLTDVRESELPVVLWMTGRVWLVAAARNELVNTLDGRCRMALIVEDDVGRGLATALRWRGLEVAAFAISELDEVDAFLQLEPNTGAALTRAI